MMQVPCVCWIIRQPSSHACCIRCCKIPEHQAGLRYLFSLRNPLPK